MKTALIAMSGGVDSSVAAYLMIEKGYTCEGVTMRLYHNEELTCNFKTCCSDQDVADARRVAARLGMPFSVLDYKEDFDEKIISKFVRTYEHGGTPNPCIDCNRFMKFDKLLSYALSHGMDHIATGHYARVEYDGERGRWLLKKAVDLSKDQSYVLYMLTQEQLSRLILPLGGLSKTETRKIAHESGFQNAAKHDSQDICFVPDGDYAGFMERLKGERYPDGEIKDLSGKVLGSHHGAVRYTPGQRKGLGISAPEPLYVTGKDMESNTVFVGCNEDLFSDTLKAGDMNWISVPGPEEGMRVKAKTRYRQTEQWATVYPEEDGKIRLKFDEPQRAITAGQAVVLYDGDIVVGGGTIVI